ncbi:MAG: amino acid permease [Candidatus Palauibacterales bacterium]|nr:amino acid permease [Candidatus Palauibacterales bacterium]MDP2583700.1 amino acid permease [Candidatus Palauibacterales bacterium]
MTPPTPGTSPPSPSQVPAAGRLPRRLGAWSAGAVLVGTTIGSGIFRVPSTAAAEVGTAGALALVWIAGAVVVVCGALTLSELSTMLPESGGMYVYLREGFGPLPAFLYGWADLVLTNPSANGAIAVIFASYLGAFLPLSDLGVRVVAAAAILGVSLANIRSVRWGAGLENATTAAKVLGLLGLAGLLFAFGSRAGGGALSAPARFAPTRWGGFGVALIAVLWAYDGWADLVKMAGEVREPGRTLPRALLGGALTVVVIYLLVNAAYLYVLPMGRMAASKLVAADAATVVFGRGGATVVAGLVALATFGSLNGSTMTGPRVFWAMAEDGLFFRPVAAVHPRWRTPWVAIGVLGALAIAFVSFRTFEQLADAFILGLWPFYTLAVSSVFVLRRRRPDAPRPFRTPGYPWVPLVFILASLGLLANAAVQRPISTLLSFGLILTGVPAYWVWRVRGGGLRGGGGGASAPHGGAG